MPQKVEEVRKRRAVEEARGVRKIQGACHVEGEAVPWAGGLASLGLVQKVVVLDQMGRSEVEAHKNLVVVV